MNTTELQALTPEQKRIRIAELRGYVRPFRTEFRFAARDGNCGCGEDGLNDAYGNWIPDYLNDLNAMHEAEAALDKGQQRDYDYALTEVTTGNRLYGGAGFDVLHATAAQRADAFLLAVG